MFYRSSIADFDENHIDIQVKIIEENDNKIIDTISVNQKYLARMDKKCVHNSVNDINIYDIILIKKDSDINSKTKELKLDIFYSTPKKGTEILSNNRIKV